MSSGRNLTLTEELEKLEQSITLTLQEIDHNFSKAHRIVTSGIIPAVQQYERHSGQVWEGTKFWKEFFEASANVSLTSEEEVTAGADHDQSHNDTEHTLVPDGRESGVTTPSRRDDDTITGEHTNTSRFEDFDTSAFDSPFAANGRVQSTPQISGAQGRGKFNTGVTSPAPGRSSDAKIRMASVVSNTENAAEEQEPSTPSAYSPSRTDLNSSPFGPLPSRGTAQKHVVNEPLFHRILDRNYRVQATPLARNPWDPVSATKHASVSSGRDVSKTPLGTGSENVAKALAGGKGPDDDSMLDSSPLNSPEMPTLSIRPEQLARSRTPGSRRALMSMTPAGERAPRTPGVSVQRPLYGTSKAPDSMLKPTVRAQAGVEANPTRGFAGSMPHQPPGVPPARREEDFTSGARTDMTAWQQRGQKTPALWDSDTDDEEPSLTMPKTLTFDLKNGSRARSGSGTSGKLDHGAGRGIGSHAAGLDPTQTRTILKTPAREASRRIVDDILSTARKQYANQSAFSKSYTGAGSTSRGATVTGDHEAGNREFPDDDTFFDDTYDDIVDFRGRAGPLRSPGLSTKRGGVNAVDDDPELDLEPSEVEYSPSIVRKAMLDVDDDAF